MHKIYYLLVLSLWLYADMLPENVLGKNCLKYYHTYENQREHKAFVYAREEETGKDRCNWAYGYPTQEEAIDSAMKHCQSVMLNAECKLLYTDGVFKVSDGAFTPLTPTDETPLSKEEIDARMQEAKAVILGNCLPFFKKYLGVTEHKSFAYSVDSNGYYACGYAYNNQTEQIAKKTAIKSCQDNKLKRGNKAPKSACKVYATNKKVLLTAKDFDIKPLPKAVKLSPEAYDAKLKQAQEIITNWPCRIQFKYYLKSKAHHAYYLVQGKDGQQMCGRSEGAFSRDAAKQKAKESCDKHALEKQIKGECKLLSEDLKFVGNKEMFYVTKEEMSEAKASDMKKIDTKKVTNLFNVIKKKENKSPTTKPKNINKPQALNKTLQITADTLNNNLPTMVDEELRLDKVSADGSKMIFNYTLVHFTAQTMGAKKLKSLMYEDIKTQVYTDKESKMMLKKGMLVDYVYKGKNKKHITTFAFDAKTCGYMVNVEQTKK